MQRYLFQVSIGPVQDFISAARRTRDLKFGSQLLSELSKVAVKQIVEQCGINSLIFPAPTELKMLEDENFNVANKLVAIVNVLPKDLGRDVYNAIQARLRKFREEAKGLRELPESNRITAEAQIDDLVEFFWVALPYTENYESIRKDVEALMAARKNTRDFSCVKWGSRQQKSSIDGKLESVIPEGWYLHSWENPTTRQAKANKLFNSFHAKPGEYLSGVDLLKRNGRLPTGDSFPSTSHFATIPFLQRLETLDDEAKKQLKQAWDTYIQKIRDIPARVESMPNGSPLHSIIGRCEGSMLLEERFPDLVDINDDRAVFKEAKKALQEFFEQVDKLFPNASPKVRPGIYYAILRADGDSMGKVIDHEAEQGPERHQQLSRKLAEFSESVRSIVESKSNQGSLIYAGGDDVLAFMPIHTVLQCAQELSTAFCTALENFKDKDDISPTLSVGIVIVHHLQPLREALELARNAEEKVAKHVDGKNALAIIISKRGGSDFTIKGHWIDFYKNLEKLIGFCREGAIPEGTAFELRDLSLRLADQTGRTDSATLLEIIEAEAKRILQRKLSFWRSNQAQADKKQILEDTHKQIIAMLADFVKSGRTPDEAPPIEHFANILIAAQIFADAMELAQPTKGTQQ